MTPCVARASPSESHIGTTCEALTNIPAFVRGHTQTGLPLNAKEDVT